MQLPDVNVLIYAHRADVPEHADYAGWLKDLVNADEPFALSELVLFGFLRIVTNPRVFVDPTPLKTALAFIHGLRENPTCHLIRPGDRHWTIFVSLCEAVRARGKLVSDAHHAAVAIEHGCEWLSADGDFARFPGLRWRHPLVVA